MVLGTIDMSRSKATLVLHEKVLLRSGVIVETKIWKVFKDKRYADGFKYSLYAVRDAQVLVGYDNHHPKGHHRHLGEREEPYSFSDLETLRNDFKADLEVELAKRGFL